MAVAKGKPIEHLDLHYSPIAYDVWEYFNEIQDKINELVDAVNAMQHGKPEKYD